MGAGVGVAAGLDVGVGVGTGVWVGVGKVGCEGVGKAVIGVHAAKIASDVSNVKSKEFFIEKSLLILFPFP
jgi:hypothetical protein